MEVQQCLIFSLLKIYTRLRKAHHYTQQEISDLLNISRQAYSNYETSKRTPDLDPFTYAMEIDTADTLYLTREEVELIKGYRAMNPEDKLLLKKLL